MLRQAFNNHNIRPYTQEEDITGVDLFYVHKHFQRIHPGAVYSIAMFC